MSAFVVEKKDEKRKQRAQKRTGENVRRVMHKKKYARKSDQRGQKQSGKGLFPVPQKEHNRGREA